MPLSLQLGEQLRQLVPTSGLTVMDLEVEGVCIRFSPLMTAAGNGSLGVARAGSGSSGELCVQVRAVASFAVPWGTPLYLRRGFFFAFALCIGR